VLYISRISTGIQKNKLTQIFAEETAVLWESKSMKTYVFQQLLKIFPASKPCSKNKIGKGIKCMGFVDSMLH